MRTRNNRTSFYFERDFVLEMEMLERDVHKS